MMNVAGGFCVLARRAITLVRRGTILYFFAALRPHYFALRRYLGRLCGAQQGGAGYGATPVNLMPNSALRVWAAIGGIAAGRKGTDISR